MIMIIITMRRPHMVGALRVDDRRLSVRPVPDPKSRMEGLSKLKLVGRKPVTRVTCEPI